MKAQRSLNVEKYSTNEPHILDVAVQGAKCLHILFGTGRGLTSCRYTEQLNAMANNVGNKGLQTALSAALYKTPASSKQFSGLALPERYMTRKREV